jgi:hypothetical protein
VRGERNVCRGAELSQHLVTSDDMLATVLTTTMMMMMMMIYLLRTLV